MVKEQENHQLIKSFNKISINTAILDEIIVYEIMCNKIPFNEIINKNQVINEVVNNSYRPKINDDLPESYRKLIENCWAQEPSERPSFDDIVYVLRMDSGFITKEINEEYYRKYINMIDEQIKKQLNLPRIIESYDNPTSQKSPNDSNDNRITEY